MTQDEPIGHLVVDPGGPGEASVVLIDRIFVGRECAGIDESRRIILGDDLAISRNHLEVRADRESRRALVFDTSGNGTRVNGVRIERSVEVPLNDGDLIQVGGHMLQFHSESKVTKGMEHAAAGTTYPADVPTQRVIVVGDVINFSTVSEVADHQILARDLDRLYGELRTCLAQHRGVLANYMGDAFFSSWELNADPEAGDNALNFVLAAAQLVPQVADTLELRYADGSPLRFGWGLTVGDVVVHTMPGPVVMMLGDAVNVAFRISSIAGREHRPTILAAEVIRKLAKGSYRFGEPETVYVKGRVGPETIVGVAGMQ
jgi:adenylate cyclase